MQAYGMLAAIGEALGAKGSIKKFSKALSGGGARMSDTADMAELRRRLAPLVAGKLVKVKA